MKNRYRSKIWQPSNEEFQEICKKYTSLADIIRHFGIRPEAGNYGTLKKRIRRDKADISHIKIGVGSNRGRSFKRKYTSKDQVIEILNNNEIHAKGQIKDLIIKFKILDNTHCSICNHDDIWNGQKLVMQLDHIDGQSDNDRLNNLRFICPNCHTQTPTHAGKRQKYRFHLNLEVKNPIEKLEYKCIDCGGYASVSKHRCRKCASKFYRPINKKFDISREELEKLVWERPTKIVAKEFGISDVALTKRCKRMGIVKPPRGYWNKRKVGNSHEESLLPKIRGIKCERKFNLEQILEIRTLLMNSEISIRDIAKKFNCAHVTIAKIRDKETYKDI